MAVQVNGKPLEFKAHLDDKQLQLAGDRIVKKFREILNATKGADGTELVRKESAIRKQVTVQIEKQAAAQKKLTNEIKKSVDISNSAAEVEAYRRSKIGEIAGGTVGGKHEELSKQTNASTALAAAQTQVEIKTRNATAALAAQAVSMQTLQLRMESYKRIAKETTDPVRRELYNKKIQETSIEITRMSNAGKVGFDQMGNAIKRNTNYLSKAWSGIRQLAALLPGFGVAGIIAFATEPILNYIKSLDLFKTKITDVQERQNALNEALNSGDYTEAVKGVDELRIKAELAKKGLYDKTAVVNEYNKSIGATAGQVKTLHEVEKGLQDNADAYIKMTLYKAAANLQLEKAAKKAAEIQEDSAKKAQDFAKGIDQLSASTAAGGGGAGSQFGVSNFDIDTYNKAIKDAGEKRKAIRQKQLQKEQNEFQANARILMEKSAEAAKAMGGVLGLDTGTDDKKKKKRDLEQDRAAERAKALQEKIIALKTEYTVQALSSDEKELQSVRNKFAEIAKEVADFNKDPKNKVKVTTDGVEGLRDQVLKDLNFKHETEKLKLNLSEQEELYKNFEETKLEFGAEYAEKRYKNEIDVTKTYLQQLQSEREKMAEIEKGKDPLTGNQLERIKFLEEEIKKQNAVIKAQDDKAFADAFNRARTHAQQLLDIENQYQRDRIALGENATAEQLEKLNKNRAKEVSSLAVDELMESEAWTNLFADLDSMAGAEIEKLLQEIESKFADLKVKFDPIDLAAVRDKLEQAKEILLKENPFKQVGIAIDSVFSKAPDGVKKTATEIKREWSDLGKATEAAFDFVDDAVQSADFLKDAIGEVGSTAITSLSTIAAVAIATTSAIKTAEKASVVLAVISAALVVIQAVANVFKSIFAKHDKNIEKSMSKHRDQVTELEGAYSQLERSISKSLGGVVYANQKAAIKNLELQRTQLEQLIALEKSKKKADSGKIQEYQSGIQKINDRIADMHETISTTIVQNSAKDLATNLANAIVEAYARGEDAAIAFGEVSKNVMANAVKHALQLQFLEKPLQKALDDLQKDMGFFKDDQFVFDGLTPEEQERFKKQVEGIGAGFTEALKVYESIFKDAPDLTKTKQTNSLAGSIQRELTEQTGTVIVGQFNGLRLTAIEHLEVGKTMLNIANQSYAVYQQIEANTRNAVTYLVDVIARMETGNAVLKSIDTKMDANTNGLKAGGFKGI